MNCTAAQQNIVLYLYGELPDEAAHSLEAHLAECEGCRREVQVVQALHRAMSLVPIEEPSANLLTRSRIRLEESLDAIPPRGPLDRVRTYVFGLGAQLRSAPVLAGLLLAAGFGAGHITDNLRAQHNPPHSIIQLQSPGNGTIANITGIIQTPNSELVQVNYNRVTPESIQGSLDDPQIRQLLLLAAQNHTAGAHDDSVGLLAQECRNGHQCGNDADGNPVRNALMTALRYDKSPTVRIKALEGLQPYIAQDNRVRDAVLEALMHDDSAAVRTQAIALIEPVGADSSVQEVLQTVSTRDNNADIRTGARKVLDQSSGIQ
jgi:hypothetical protein